MFIILLLQYLLQAIIMTSHPVLITQNEEIVTMDNTDNEEMKEPILTIAITTYQVTENLVVQEATPQKKTCSKRPSWIF